MSLLLWKPAGTATPAAPVTGWNPPDVPTLHARIAWRPEDITGSYGFTALPWDGSSTSGWITSGTATSGPVSSLTTTSSDSFGGGSCLEMVTNGTAASGVDYDVSGGTFTAGREYTLRAGARNLSGSTSLVLRIGNGSDFATATATTDSGWDWYTCDWTPGTAVTDARVSLQNGAAATQSTRIDHVEVYEKLDEVALDSLTVTRGSSFDGGREPPGRIDFGVLDPTDLYTPRNTSSALYGSVEPQRKVHIRATYGGRLYPIAYGTLRSISPDPDTRTVRFSADDGLAELDGYSISRPFAVTGSYRAARAAALSDEALGTAQHSLATDSIEADTMIDGTDAAVGLLDYLDGFNEATGTLHYCQPHVEAVRPWRYTTITRASQTESLTGTVIDEDFQRLTAADLRDEAYVTRQRVGWRGYEVLDSQVVVQATAEKPYWTYTDEQYGSSEEPEIEGVYIVKWKRGNKKKRRWKRKKIGNRWVDAQVPIEFVNGQTVERIIDFDVPMEDVTVAVTDGGNITTTSTIEPARITISMTASATDTVTDIVVTAKPRIPLDDQEEVVTTSGATVIREGNPIDSEHTASGGQATGLATYRTWRYGAGRMRPSVTDQHQPARQLTIDIGSHLTLSADRWFLSSVPCVVRSLRHEVSAKGLEWETTYGVEEVEAGNTWVTLGGGASRGIGSSAALAY